MQSRTRPTGHDGAEQHAGALPRVDEADERRVGPGGDELELDAVERDVHAEVEKARDRYNPREHEPARRPAPAVGDVSRERGRVRRPRRFGSRAQPESREARDAEERRRDHEGRPRADRVEGAAKRASRHGRRRVAALGHASRPRVVADVDDRAKLRARRPAEQPLRQRKGDAHDSEREKRERARGEKDGGHTPEHGAGEGVHDHERPTVVAVDQGTAGDGGHLLRHEHDSRNPSGGDHRPGDRISHERDGERLEARAHHRRRVRREPRAIVSARPETYGTHR